MRQNQAKGMSLILVFTFPILGLFSAIRHLRWAEKKVIIVLFTTIYASLLRYDDAADAARYMEMLFRYDGMSLPTFLDTTVHIMTFDPIYGYANDLYVHSLSFLNASVLGLHGLFYPMVGFIYGYFYASGMSKILVWDKGKKLTFSVLFIIMLFIIHRSVTNLQTVRTWTGLWILFNGVVGYHQTKNRKYIFLMMVAPLIHFAYFVMALPAFAALFYKRIPKKLIIGLYAISFFTTINPGGVINSAEDNALAKEKVRSYYRENQYGEGVDPIMERRKITTSVWYAKYGQTDAVYYGGHAFALFLILGGFFAKRMTDLEVALFTTGIMTATLANFGGFAYAFYSRTMANAVIYILATVALMAIRGAFSKDAMPMPRFMNMIKWICMLIFIPKIVYFLADFIGRTSIFITGMPFLGWINQDLNVSIREFIGDIFNL